MGHSTEYQHLDDSAAQAAAEQAWSCPCGHRSQAFHERYMARVELGRQQHAVTEALRPARDERIKLESGPTEVAEGVNYMVDVTVAASLTDAEIRRQIAGLLREQADRLEQEEGPIDRS